MNFEEAETYVDGWMHIIYQMRVMPDGVVVGDEYECPIQDGVRFFASHRDR